MPKLIKLYITQCLIGFGLSAVFTVLVLWFNIANIAHLAAKDPMGWLAVTMMWIFNGTVFGAVQFAWKIMQMRDDGAPQDPHGGTRIKGYLGKSQDSDIDPEEDLKHLGHNRVVAP